MHDFESKKREVLDRVDLLAVAAERVKLQRKGRRWVGLCPFHSEKTPSFAVSPDMGLFKCFGCGKGGDLFTFVEEIERVSFMEAFEILADRAGVDLARTRSPVAGAEGSSESNAPKQPRVSRADLAKVNEWALSWFRATLADDAVGQTARTYLTGRGFTEDALATFEVGLAPADSNGLLNAAQSAGYALPLLVAADLMRQGDGGGVYATFRSRIMFPIRDAMGRVVGFGGRTLVDDPAKYLNTRQTALFDKGRGLFGVHLARGPIKDKGRAIVVEGYTDCMAAHQAGFGETVATLGTALTEHQVDLLHRYGDDVILLFDSDQAGEAAADRAITVALPRCVAVRLARIPDGKDPSEFLQHHPASALEGVLNGAIGALEFKWHQTRARFCGDDSDANRREAVLSFLGVVADATQTRAIDVIQRGLMINQVAHLLQMDRAGVDRLLAGLQRRAARRRATSEHRDASKSADAATAQGAVAHRAIPRDREQASWTCLLEVVLNEPGLLGTVEHLPDVNRITHPVDRRIAAAAWDLFEKYGAFTMADMLARCRDREFAERVAALASRGSARANFEPTFQAALERLSRCSRTPMLDERARALYGSAGHGAGSTGLNGLEEASGSMIREELCGHRHFAPRRLLRRALGAPNGSASNPDNPATTLE
ncbi:MAG: DNA primase [Phycisphaerae bacterium]